MANKEPIKQIQKQDIGVVHQGGNSVQAFALRKGEVNGNDYTLADLQAEQVVFSSHVAIVQLFVDIPEFSGILTYRKDAKQRKHNYIGAVSHDGAGSGGDVGGADMEALLGKYLNSKAGKAAVADLLGANLDGIVGEAVKTALAAQAQEDDDGGDETLLDDSNQG